MTFDVLIVKYGHITITADSHEEARSKWREMSQEDTLAAVKWEDDYDTVDIEKM